MLARTTSVPVTPRSHADSLPAARASEAREIAHLAAGGVRRLAHGWHRALAGVEDTSRTLSRLSRGIEGEEDQVTDSSHCLLHVREFHSRLLALLLAALGLGSFWIAHAQNAFRFKGEWPQISGGFARGVQVVGNLAYVADGFAGLQIIDASNPANPVHLGGYATIGYAYGVQVVGSLAYVADDTAGLQILDLSNPANPIRLGGFADPGGNASSVQVVGNLAYVVDGAAGLQIIDVSNPAQPVRLGGYDSSGYALGVQVVGNLAYVADGAVGLQIIDVSNPTNPILLGGYATSGFAGGVQVVGNLAYVAVDNAGLQILDVSNPANPVRLGGFADTGGNALSVQVVGNLAYLADYADGLEIIDVSNPANPISLGGYDTSGYAFGVQVVGNLAYVADGAGGLQVLEPAPLAITKQLTDAALPLGYPIPFVVIADGFPPLTYLWRLDGQPLDGQTNQALSSLVAATNLGGYDVIVGNASGSVTSSVARLTLTTNVVEFAVTNLTVSELQGVVSVPLRRTGFTDALSLPLIAGGTAAADIDYSGLATATILTNKTAGSIKLRIIDNIMVDGNRTLTLTLGAGDAPDVVIGTNSTVTITILDNDTAQRAGVGFDDGVRAIFPLPEGGALVAGNFTFANGLPRAGVARLRSDESLDASFNPIGLTGSVLAVAQAEAGDVLVGSGGLHFGRTGRTNSALFRLTVTGQYRDVFNRTATNGGYANTDPVSRILSAPGNHWWVAGVYSQSLAPSGTTFNPINTVRLLDTDGASLPMLENSTIAVVGPISHRSNDGLIAVARVSGTNRLCEIDPVGRLATVWPVVTNWSRTIVISALAERADGSIYVVGDGTLYLLKPDGVLDSSFVQTNRVDTTANLLLPLPYGRLLMGGSFAAINDQTQVGLAMFEPNGTLSPAEATPLVNGPVNALEQTANGDVLLGGDFTQLSGQPAFRYARLPGLARSAPLEISADQGTVLVTETVTNATVMVRRSDTNAGEVRVGYHVRAGTATAGTDFQETDGELVFVDGGAVTQAIQVPLTAANNIPEGDRTILVTLDKPSLGQISPGHDNAVVLIQDDDEGALAELHSLEYLASINYQPPFASLDFTHPLITRVDREINFDWAYATPMTGTQDRFAVRWRALLVPTVTGPYTFISTTDDGCQLWVDGRRLINYQASAAATVNRATNSLVAGQPVQLEFEFYDTLANGAARLEWSAPGLPRQVIPETALRPVPFYENAVATNDFSAFVTNTAVPVFHHALATDGGSVGYDLTADGQTLQSGKINFPAGQSVSWVPLPLFAVQTTDTNWLLTLHDALGGVISQRLTTSRLRFPPLLAEGPTNRTLASGVPLNLRAAAFGAGPWAYQWQHSGTNLPAATNVLLNLLSVSPNDSGNYQLIAQSGTNVFKGPLTRITVTHPPTPPTLRIGSPTPDGPLTLTVSVAAGQSAVVESSVNLTDWQLLSTLSGSGTIILQTAGQREQFYRARNQFR